MAEYTLPIDQPDMAVRSTPLELKQDRLNTSDDLCSKLKSMMLAMKKLITKTDPCMIDRQDKWRRVYCIFFVQINEDTGGLLLFAFVS